MEGAIRDAVNGGLGGAVATALAYPLIIAKVRNFATKLIINYAPNYAPIFIV